MTSRLFHVSAPLLAIAVTAAGRAAPAGGSRTAVSLDSLQSPSASHAPPLIAEGTIDLAQQRVLFPITVNGHQTTAILDLGTTANLITGSEASALGISGAIADSVAIGSSVQHQVAMNVTGGNSYGGASILMGSPFQSNYDIEFDGPAGKARLYARSVPKGSTPPATPVWLPRGVTPADCLPMTGDDKGFDRVFFATQVNGHLVHSLFDSGSSSSNINVYGTREADLTTKNGHVHKLLFPAGRLGQYPGLWEATGAVMTVGGRPLAEDSLTVFRHIPRENQGPGIQDGELSVGLSAVRDRVMFVSYSTNQMCLGAPVKGAGKA